MEGRPLQRAARNFRRLVVAALSCLCLCANITGADLDLEAQCALSKSIDVLQRYVLLGKRPQSTCSNLLNTYFFDRAAYYDSMTAHNMALELCRSCKASTWQLESTNPRLATAALLQACINVAGAPARVRVSRGPAARHLGLCLTAQPL